MFLRADAVEFFTAQYARTHTSMSLLPSYSSTCIHFAILISRFPHYPAVSFVVPIVPPLFVISADSALTFMMYLLPYLLLSLSIVSCYICVSVSVILTNTTSLLSSPSTTHLNHPTPLPSDHPGCPKYIFASTLPSPPVYFISATRHLHCLQYCL